MVGKPNYVSAHQPKHSSFTDLKKMEEKEEGKKVIKGIKGIIFIRNKKTGKQVSYHRYIVDGTVDEYGDIELKDITIIM